MAPSGMGHLYHWTRDEDREMGDDNCKMNWCGQRYDQSRRV